MIHFLANPSNFLKLKKKLFLPISVITAALLAFGYFQVFTIVPNDYQQGETIKIMYMHVPSSWMALGCYSFMTIMAIFAFIWQHSLADIACKVTAPIGACFTFVSLATGALWGKPMWGAWWVWDARLTSVLILFFMYLGYMLLTSNNKPSALRSGRFMILLGAINLPIIKFSVEWWNTLHQPASVIRLDGPTIHSSMLTPLLIVFAGFACFFITIFLMNMESELLKAKKLRQKLKAVKNA